MTREEAKVILKGFMENPLFSDIPKVCRAFDMAIKALEQEPKTGHWIEHEQNGISHIECSECLTWFLRCHLLRNSFCPNCGCRMIDFEPQESEDKNDRQRKSNSNGAYRNMYADRG